MQRYEYSDGKSRKFWQIEQAESELLIRWGKLGTAGQSQVKQFDDDAQATAAMDKLIAEKTKKGYAAVGDGAGSGSGLGADDASASQAQPAAEPAGGQAANASAAGRKPVAKSRRKAAAAGAAPADAARPDVGEDEGDNGLAGAALPSPAAPKAEPAEPASADAQAQGAELQGAALSAWLAACRASPGFDEQLLAAWTELLTQLAGGDLSPVDPKPASAAQLKKRFGLDGVGARVLAEWLRHSGAGFSTHEENPARHVPATARDLLADARLTQLQERAHAAHEAQWADWAGPEATKVTELTRFAHPAAVPHFFTRRVVDESLAAQEWPKRRGQMLDVLKRIDDAHSEPSCITYIVRLKNRLKSGDTTPDEGADVLMLALSNLGSGTEVDVDAQLIAANGLVGYVRLLLQALQVYGEHVWNWRLQTLTRTPHVHRSDQGWSMSRILHVSELLRHATPAIRGEVEALILGGLHAVLPQRRVYLALLLRESEAVAQAVWDSPGFEPEQHGHFLMACALSPALKAQLPQGGRGYGSAWVWRALQDGWPDAQPHGQPDTLERALREADSKDKVQALEEMQARWPMAMLIAAARVAVSGDRQAPAALGLLRGLLPALGPALALAKPWLSAPTWRWLQAQAQPQAAVVLADAADLPPVLANPPWLQKKAKGAPRRVLPLQTLPLAPALNWVNKYPLDPSELGPPETDPAKLADLISSSYEDTPGLAAIAEAIRARDLPALIAAWRADRKANLAQGIATYLHGQHVLQLGPELGIGFCNALADEVMIWFFEVLVDAWGVAVMPGLLVHLQSSSTLRTEHWVQVGVTDFAAESARMAFRAKQPAQRFLGQAWLSAWPEHAATALLPAALGPDGHEQQDAAAALRHLDAKGQRALLLAVAQRYADASVDASAGAEVEHALLAALNQDPLALYPSKVAKLPEFWQPQQWQRPQLHSGQALPDAAVDALGQMLSFARPAGVYAGLAQAMAACTRESLSAFAWDLFSAWLAAGSPAKDNWAFTALGLLGDDLAVHKLAPLMRAWPTDGASARATLGLHAMAELGSDSALRLVADLGAESMPKGLRAQAQTLLQAAADARGMSAEDLGDRLVPDLGLDARGQTQLDFGARQFLLGLDENLKPFLRKLENGQPGARLKSFPAKNASDAPEKAQAASERYKAIKAQAEAVAKVQIRRLEQAMVAGRRWSRADFELLYVRQPLLRQLASRLIWGVFEDHADAADAAAVQAASPRQRPERLLQALRLSDDGELSTADDASWAWREDEAGALHLGLIHPLELSETERAAFAQLLADYERMQPFEQLARWTAPDMAPEARDAHVATLSDAGRSYSPFRLLALKTRGWTLNNDGGIGWSGATRELGEGLCVHLWVTPGVDMYDVRSAPPQQLNGLALRQAAPGQTVSWAALDALAFSEVLRELAYLAL